MITDVPYLSPEPYLNLKGVNHVPRLTNRQKLPTKPSPLSLIKELKRTGPRTDSMGSPLVTSL